MAHTLSSRKAMLLGLHSFSGSYLPSSVEGSCSSELKEEDLWEGNDEAWVVQDDGDSMRKHSNCRRKHRFSDDHVHHQSAPVNVPDWSQILGAEERSFRGLQNMVSGEDEEDEDEKLPPHEVVARQYAKSQAPTFSVCEGAGRTLKGMDLDRVRNAVLRKTGFLDL